MSNREKYAGSAWAPGWSMDTAPGPLGIRERSWDGVEQGENGDRALHPEFQGVWRPGTFCIPNPAMFQNLLHPKSAAS